MPFDIPKTPLERKLGEALHAASEYFGEPITREYITQRSQKPEIAHRRQWCMAYVRWANVGISQPRVARMFKKKDHTTVLYGERRARQLYPDAIFSQWPDHSFDHLSVAGWSHAA